MGSGSSVVTAVALVPAAAQVQSLAWELLHTLGVAPPAQFFYSLPFPQYQGVDEQVAFLNMAFDHHLEAWKSIRKERRRGHSFLPSPIVSVHKHPCIPTSNTAPHIRCLPVGLTILDEPFVKVLQRQNTSSWGRCNH